MIAKAELIRKHLAGLHVLDLGGSGYGGDNAYEQELQEAWSLCKKRTCVDCRSDAEVPMDFNRLPLPAIEGSYDMATAFDVLEHLEHPVDVLRWIPAKRLIVTLPNALSCIARRMEQTNGSKHLYSFTAYTASILMGEGGWEVREIEYQFGKWSMLARLLNLVGSICPSRVGTGLVLHCERTGRGAAWKLR